MVEPSKPNTSLYLPPTRTSISHESNETGNDFGAHQRWNNSGLVHASYTMRAGPCMVRLTTSSRSDVRSTVARSFTTGSLLGLIDLLLSCQLLDDRVQLIEACVPELAVHLHPLPLFLEPAWAEHAGPHASDLLRGDEPGLLQHADVLLHAREGHVERGRQVADRSVGTS